jgi:hypothetical protein
MTQTGGSAGAQEDERAWRRGLAGGFSQAGWDSWLPRRRQARWWARRAGKFSGAAGRRLGKVERR